MASANLQLAVFDIDGTLTDSVAAHQAAFVEALRLMGYQGFRTDWGSYPHHTDLAIFRKIHEACKQGAVEAGDVRAFERHLTDHLAAQCRTSPIAQLPDAALFLKRLGRQYDIVFATGSLLEPALLKLRQAGIAHPEALVVASNDCHAREEIVTQAIARAKAHYGRPQYARIVSFGDGLWDLRAAQALGLDFIGIGNPALQQQGVREVFPHYAHEGLYKLLGLHWPDEHLPDFVINDAGPVSRAFMTVDAHTFQEAMRFIKALPYGRNRNKADLLSIFAEGRGTCGTKHALLKQLASENGFGGLQLMAGMFRMHARNTLAVADVLGLHRLKYLPEAHNYLRYQGHIIDCTFAGAGIRDFEAELLTETEMEPEQIGQYKVEYHKAFLQEWLHRNPEVKLSPEGLWEVREQCIQALSTRR